MKFIILFLMIVSTTAFSAEIDMFEKQMPLNTAQVEKVIVQGPKIIVRSYIRPCAHYPGFPTQVYGDLYECITSREHLNSFIKDPALFSLDDYQLGEYLVKSKIGFKCNDKHDPVLMTYQGKNVYLFSGLVFEVR